MKKLSSSIIICIVLLVSCGTKHNQEDLDTYFEGGLSKYNRQLTDVIVADIFTPPVASRIYAYSNVAAYEGIRFMEPSKKSLASKLNDLEKLSEPESSKQYYYPLVSAVSFLNVGKSLVFDLDKVEAIKSELLKEVREIGIDEEVYENSVSFGEQLAAEILAWAAKDGYLRRTALPRYSVSEDAGRWRPTPPDYMEAIEPHWNTIRPFVLQSAGQFDPGLPTSFDVEKDSKFYKEAMEVYSTVNQLDDKQLEVAKFWDCNPNISHTKGHVMYFQQQISPGGHWMHIAAQVLEEQKAGVVESAETMSLVGVTIADAFISCWDQKYKSSLTRPETYINNYIDQDWEPILQTPAFPEHTSGHSVASSAAATALTQLFGEDYAFVDATEVPYGLPPRSFQSFWQAAEEAAISRLYGGIHYRPAIELGVQQGKAIGNFVVQQLK
ncbi:vanadium-dependent haloperoxidase [Zobellia sp. 1_MG-2023]|uniref:vanadium-dependent haloperoxidase n=1 Tax=Zobellia sp. 1_MG-2023 TaxID=3062626 RepID=UPI0026E240F6|nr:vanadium-dependent haloperoxidase [Zobellia sp. 1_MG-2023]MDO6817823.1 vanadium-dependent haloperoxidase [Zobellia sp. 1_MG-2023]